MLCIVQPWRRPASQQHCICMKHVVRRHETYVLVRGKARLKNRSVFICLYLSVCLAGCLLVCVFVSWLPLCRLSPPRRALRVYLQVGEPNVLAKVIASCFTCMATLGMSLLGTG